MATDDNGERIRDMAKFLNTSATNYFLEELIKTAKDRLILLRPDENVGI